MAKSTVKIKHLGIWSTAKFAGAFSFILSILMLLVSGLIFGVFLLFSMLIGSAVGGVKGLLGSLFTGSVGAGMFLVGAVAFVVVYTILGFIMGAIMSIAFNMVVKVSGGLSFDAEIA
jgi:hypothetical protein